MIRSKLTSVIAVTLLLSMKCIPALWRMDCLSNGRTVLSWGRAERCVPLEKGLTDHALDNSCCAFGHVMCEAVSFLEQDDLQVIEVGSSPVVTVAMHRSIAERSTDGPAHVRPPPLSRTGRDIGILYRRFLV